MTSKEQRRTLAELAEESGIPARTIRFYIARGLLDGPEVAGRGASYGEEHLARLKEIKSLQSRGLTLAEIACRLGGRGAERELPAPSAWWKYRLTEDVVVLVKADSSPWRLRQVQSALRALAAVLAENKE